MQWHISQSKSAVAHEKNEKSNCLIRAEIATVEDKIKLEVQLHKICLRLSRLTNELRLQSCARTGGTPEGAI